MALLFVTMPFVVRSVQPTLMELDKDMEEAAASLGAGGLTIFRKVILPNLMPALMAGAALAFARAIGEFGSLVLLANAFDTKVASIFIFEQIEAGRTATAAALSVVLLLMSVAILFLIQWFGTQGGEGMSAPTDPGRPNVVTGGSGIRWSLRGLALGYLALLLILPLLVVIQQAFFPDGFGDPNFAGVWESLTTPEAQHAFYLTLVMVAIAVPLNTVFGVACAIVLVRHKFRGKGFLNSLIDLPFAISPVVIGLALLIVYGINRISSARSFPGGSEPG